MSALDASARTDQGSHHTLPVRALLVKPPRDHPYHRIEYCLNRTILESTKLHFAKLKLFSTGFAINRTMLSLISAPFSNRCCPVLFAFQDFADVKDLSHMLRSMRRALNEYIQIRPFLAPDFLGFRKPLRIHPPERLPNLAKCLTQQDNQLIFRSGKRLKLLISVFRKRLFRSRPVSRAAATLQDASAPFTNPLPHAILKRKQTLRRDQ